MHTVVMIEDEVVDALHMHAATERSRRRFNISAMTYQRHRIAHAIEPHSCGGFGLNIGALGFLVAGHSAAQLLDGGQFTAAAHEPRKTMNQRLIHQAVVDNEVFVTGQQHAAAHVLGPRIRGIAVARPELGELACAQVVKRLREHVHADGAELAVLENAEAGAEVGVLIGAVTHVFRAVEAVGLASREEVHRAASAFVGHSPAVVRPLINLL